MEKKKKKKRSRCERETKRERQRVSVLRLRNGCIQYRLTGERFSKETAINQRKLNKSTNACSATNKNIESNRIVVRTYIIDDKRKDKLAVLIKKIHTQTQQLTAFSVQHICERLSLKCVLNAIFIHQ